MISAQFRVCVSGVYIVCVSVYVVCVCVCVSASGYASCDSSPYVASSNSFWLSVCPPILKDLLLGCACCTIHIHHTYTDFFISFLLTGRAHVTMCVTCAIF